MATRCKSELQCRDTCGRNDKESRWYKVVSPELDYIREQRRLSSKKVHSSARRKLGRQLEDDMLEVDVNMMIWGTFMSATMKAAVHLGQDDQGNLRTTKNTDFEKGKQLFDRS